MGITSGKLLFPAFSEQRKTSFGEAEIADFRSLFFAGACSTDENSGYFKPNDVHHAEVTRLLME